MLGAGPGPGDDGPKDGGPAHTPVATSAGRMSRAEATPASPAPRKRKAEPPGPAAGAEEERQERIRANRARMAELGLLEAADAVRGLLEGERAERRAASQRGKRAHRAREAAPPRRSGRLQQQPAENAGLPSAGGVLMRVGGETVRLNPALLPGGGAAAAERDRTAPVEFRCGAFSEGADAAFLRGLGTAGASARVAATARRAGEGLRGWALAEGDVCKVTPSAIPHVALHPRDDAVVVVAGDKLGNVGLWNATLDGWEAGAPLGAAGELAEIAEADGVAVVGVHGAYVSGLCFSGGGLGATLFSASYDGTVRRLDGARGAFVHVWGGGEWELSAMDANAAGTAVAVAEKGGGVALLDPRTGELTTRGFVDAHARKPNCLSWEPGSEHCVVSSGTDGAVQVWDVRRWGPRAKPASSATFAKSCQGAYFNPSGDGRVVVTSFDNTLRVLSTRAGGAGLAEERSVKHDNETGRWVLPFRATWASNGRDVLSGSMRRGVDVVDPASGAVDRLDSEFQTAICSRMTTHRTLPVLCAASGSGRCHLYMPGG